MWMSNVPTSAPLDSQPAALDDHVNEVIRETEQQLRQLMAERKAIVKRIRTVKQTITGLANMFNEAVTDPASLELIGRYRRSRPRGLTQACRQVLLDAGRPLNSRDLLDGLKRRAPALLASHADSMATINTILNRLVEYGEVTLVSVERGKREWLWSGTTPNEPSPQNVNSPGSGR